ncbi:MAG: flagellar hook-basal body complex protein [Helicobacteraceae bacterium]|jgi:flagellar hook-basal body protein|nr:flagellar hook-basal body complex protein [Helicobacteraceae bacterium]
MNGGFWSALTGAKTHQNAIDTTANNIANINTTGYRASMMEFASLFSRSLATNSQTLSSDDGVGVRTSATSIDVKSGAYRQTDNVFDVAITDDGWFGVVGSNIYDAKKIVYTRDGAFSRDANGNLVTQNGNYLLGSSWGALINDNGVWKIVPDASAGVIGVVGTQSAIFAPDNIVYPAIATKNATMKANLPSPASRVEAAAQNAPIASLYDQNGVYMGLSEGNSLLISAGDNANLFVADGEIKKTITINDAMSSPLTLTINGAAINATWATGADENAISAAIADAINLSGAASATRNGATLTISSPNALSIADANNGFFAPLNAAIWTAASASTLADLQNAIQQTAQSVYPQAKTLLRYDSKIAVNNPDSFSLLIANGGNAPESLLQAFGSFDGSDKTAINSSIFKQSVRNAEQTAIAPNGDRLTIASSVRLVKSADLDSGATYEAKATLKRLGAADANGDLGSIVQGGAELGLKGGEDLWFSFGKLPSTTDRGLGYGLSLASDQADGTPPFVRFTLDGASYEYTGADGDDVLTTMAGITAILKAAGYETSASGTHLIIYPQGDRLVFSGGESSLPNASFTPMSLGRVAYSAGESIGDYISEINQIASQVGASAALDNAKISVTSGAQAIASGVYGGDNTPDALKTLFAPLNAALAANSATGGGALEAYKTISEQSSIVALDKNGAVISGGAVTLDNNGTPINFRFDLSANAALAESSDISADGVIEGNLDDYTIDEYGRIIATFDNGRQSAIAQIAIYHFANDQGLMRVGGTQFMQSENSGEPFFYIDANGEQRSVVVGSYLESSNVQAAVALSDLIVYQRAYEGAAKAITTNDELIKNAIGLKR